MSSAKRRPFCLALNVVFFISDKKKNRIKAQTTHYDR